MGVEVKMCFRQIDRFQNIQHPLMSLVTIERGMDFQRLIERATDLPAWVQ